MVFVDLQAVREDEREALLASGEAQERWAAFLDTPSPSSTTTTTSSVLEPFSGTGIGALQPAQLWNPQPLHTIAWSAAFTVYKPHC